jgi:hypothetical protein
MPNKFQAVANNPVLQTPGQLPGAASPEARPLLDASFQGCCNAVEEDSPGVVNIPGQPRTGGSSRGQEAPAAGSGLVFTPEALPSLTATRPTGPPPSA